MTIWTSDLPDSGAVGALQARLRFDTSDVVLAVAPFFHILGATALLTVPLSVGATIIAPAQLESLRLTHPAVADVVVFGQPDERTGEAPVALVVRRSDDVTAAGLREWLDPQVAHYKRLRDVRFVDAIPRSPSGKVLKHVLS